MGEVLGSVGICGQQVQVWISLRWQKGSSLEGYYFLGQEHLVRQAEAGWSDPGIVGWPSREKVGAVRGGVRQCSHQALGHALPDPVKALV